MSKYICVISEKPDMGSKIAEAIGGVKLSSGDKLTTANAPKLERIIKSDRFKYGKFEGVAENGVLKGKKIIYSWCFGHIASLWDAKDYDDKYKKWDLSLYPFVPEKFNRKINEDFERHFKLLKELMTSSDCEMVINATDADREGELIFDDIMVLSGTKKPIKRLWLNETNDEGILKAFDNLKNYKDMEALRDSARARLVADWISGINLTVVATKLFSEDGGMLSAGRVQTPTLNIIVKREKDILNFIPENYFEIIGVFDRDTKKYQGTLTIGKETKFKDEAKVNDILGKVKGKPAEIKNVITEEKIEVPPMFYDLGSIQGDANAKFGFTLKKTLDIVQSLYEAGYVSYPRTECRTIPEGERYRLNLMPDYLPTEYSRYTDQMRKTGFKLGSRYVKNSEASHFAIIPVGKCNISKLSEDQKKVYDLIAKSIIAAYLGNATWSQSKITTEVNGYYFITSGKSLLVPGFREIIPMTKEEPILPIVKEKENVDVVSIKSVSKKTQPPARYTEKTLKEAMEGCGRIVQDEELKEILKDGGIGTPATRAEIVEKLINVKYIERSGKSIKPTAKGIWFIEKLPIDDIKSPELTGKWEKRLSDIAKGKDHYNDFLEDIKKFVIDNCDNLKNMDIASVKGTNMFKNPDINKKEVIGKCPICGCDMYENDKSYYCSGYKAGCKGSIWKADKSGNPVKYGGRKITKTIVKTLLSKKETGELTFTNKDGNEYKDKLYLTINEGKYINIQFGWQLKKKNK